MTTPNASNLDAAELFRIGAEVQGIIDSAEHEVRTYDGWYRFSEWAATLAFVLRRLLEHGDIETLREAISCYRAAQDGNNAAYERGRARQEKECAEAVRRHELAVKVECPYCGAAPGVVCRSTGPSTEGHAKGVHDHTARYRAATSDKGQRAEVRQA
jgi:hypothetical protein